MGTDGAPRERDFYRPSRADVVLIVVVLAVSTFSIIRVAQGRRSDPAGPTAAVVKSGDDEIARLDLGLDTVYDLADEGMRLEVKGGRVRVLESDCPQQICVHSGWIERPGQVVACVPNRVIVTVESEDEPFLDAIVQ
jgi:hypothetical protein